MPVASGAGLRDLIAAGGIPGGAPVVSRRVSDEPVQLDPPREGV